MRYVFKRLIDLTGSSIALVILLPILISISIGIKLDSKGPILFKQSRLTKNGKIFTILKFRTMVVNAEQMGSGLYNFKNDKRITRFGSFLRKSSLDELPQLFNVFVGNMSIVGPRPSVVNEIGPYDKLNNKYKKRFAMKSGITGLAQVSGRNELPWPTKIEFDNKYIDLFKKYGVLIDIKIIFLTILKIFKMNEVFEEKKPEYFGLSDIEISQIETKKIIEEATRID